MSFRMQWVIGNYVGILQARLLRGRGKSWRTARQAHRSAAPSLACTVSCRTIEQKRESRVLMAPARKIERIEARVQPAQKDRIEYAASLKGTSVSDFMVQSADAAAVATIREHETWKLTNEDRDLFVSALLNPPEPNKRMRAAAARYTARRK
jgi:uncharacterized protein (DUF1778 family)